MLLLCLLIKKSGDIPAECTNPRRCHIAHIDDYTKNVPICQVINIINIIAKCKNDVIFLIKLSRRLGYETF